MSLGSCDRMGKKKGMEINPRKITDNIEIPPSAIRAKKKMPVLSLDYFIWDVYIN